MYASHSSGKRLVIFVHGFGGSATGTWREFPTSGNVAKWWQESDMLFVGYDSTKDSIPGVASRLRLNIDRFYPKPFQAAMMVDGAPARDDILSDYQELVLVGHSLGGLVARRALLDAAQLWMDDRDAGPVERPRILDAQLRLFSPASAGFRAAGLLGAIMALGPIGALDSYLRKSSAYIDLQPGSTTLEDTRRRTELMARRPGTEALRARILWANPDDVVIAERYDSDFVDAFEDGQSHQSICKPNSSYQSPWRFAETGRTL